MSWGETCPMNEKMKFIVAHQNNEDTFIVLCEKFNISRKTGYKYLKRYAEEGIDGLKERSREPHKHWNQTPESIEQKVLDVKDKHPYWGPKKIVNWLQQEYNHTVWPAKSTVEGILKRHGKVNARHYKRRTPPYINPFILCEKANDVWSIDYKGQFALTNQQLCYPLTITDNYSRYLLACEAFERISGVTAKEVLIRLFLEFGLPSAIKSDNGPPFAGNGLGGLSRLSVWLLRLGIFPERIRPGHPEENGRHERMHLTLKKETTKPPEENCQKQQALFNRFCKEYNYERPHEGIDFKRPAWLYTNSERVYPHTLPEIEYSHDVETRSIRTNGTMKWCGKEIFITETLIGERIALMPCGEDDWIIYYSSLPIGLFNEKKLKAVRITV